MGSATGFLETIRTENPYRSEAVRLCDFEDLHTGQGEDARRAQASRCMNCGVPFCQSDFGCPLHNLIPEWNDLLYRGLEREALNRLLQTAPFPEFRLPLERTGKRVAVIGSGPSGLAAADLLNRMGHSVTVIEKADRAGGLLTYGIPNMKLPKRIVERRIRLMEEEGVRFELNREAIPEELQGFDAILLCGGARKPRTLNVEHTDTQGVMFAVDYLTAATKAVLDGGSPSCTAEGKHVIVVGGGDTGNDCVGTALRQGCASVTQLEMMPAPPEERTQANPWPEWPRVLRTDYGQLEAIFRQGADPRVYETTVKSIRKDEAGRIAGLETVQLRRTPEGKFEQVAGSEKELECELLLIAAGFVGCENKTLERFALQADGRGRLMPEDGSHHLNGRLFSAGDMRTGQSLVVRALADGRAAAKEVDRFLTEPIP